MSKSKHLLGTGMVLSIGFIGALLILRAWSLPPFHSAVETTENAYVKGQVTTISPQLSGYVAHTNVTDFQTVKAGDILFVIDDRIYRERLMQARANLDAKRAALDNWQQKEEAAEATIRSGEAQLNSAQAGLRLAESNQGRVQSLLGRGISTQSAADQARSTLSQARAAVNQAEAAVEVMRQELESVHVGREGLLADIQGAEAAEKLAEIDVQNTRIRAPIDGRLGEIAVRLGNYVAAGSMLTSLVSDSRWIIANFKETQLSHIHTGQQARFTVDALDGAELTGHIVDLSPATGSEFSVLKADNATGNFTKIAQRLAVRIAIDPKQVLAQQLVPGLSVVVRIDTAQDMPSRENN